MNKVIKNNLIDIKNSLAYLSEKCFSLKTYIITNDSINKQEFEKEILILDGILDNSTLEIEQIKGVIE